MSALSELAVRCEAASHGNERELLAEAHAVIEASGLPVTPKERFAAALDAEAFESAAWSLAPHDWSRHLCAVSTVGGTAILMQMEGDVVRIRIEAVSPALAMCAALLVAWDYTLQRDEALERNAQ